MVSAMVDYVKRYLPIRRFIRYARQSLIRRLEGPIGFAQPGRPMNHLVEQLQPGIPQLVGTAWCRIISRSSSRPSFQPIEPNGVGLKEVNQSAMECYGKTPLNL